MDLDDSFTEGLIQRAKVRREYLSKQKMELTGKKRTALIDEHQVHSDEPPNKSPKCQAAYSSQEIEDSNALFVPVISASETRGLAALKSNCYGNEQPNKSLKWQSAQTLQTTYSTNNKENTVMQTEDSNAPFSASRTRGLAALKKSSYRITENDSSFHAASKFEVNQCDAYVYSTNSKDLCSGQKSRLASIASRESGTHKPTLSLENAANASNSLSTKLSNSASKGGVGSLSSCEAGHRKLQVWDEAVMTTLENSLSVRSPACVTQTSDVTTKEPADAQECNENNFSRNITSVSKELGCLPSKQQDLKLSEAAKKSSSPIVQDSVKLGMDPAELPLAARKALFENAFMNGTPKVNKDISHHKLSVAERAALFENASKANCRPTRANVKVLQGSPRTDLSKFDRNCHGSPVKTKIAPNPVKVSPIEDIASPPLSASQFPSKHSGNHHDLIEHRLIEKSDTQEDEMAEGGQKQETSSLVHQSVELASSNEAIEDLAYEDKQEDDPSDEDSDTTDVFNLPYAEKKCLENGESVLKRKGSSESTSYSGISSYTDDSYASHSQSCTSGSSVGSYDINQESPKNRKEKNPEVPLLYTVSFYRKQKQETRLTPVCTIVHGNKERSTLSSDIDTDNTEYIKERLKVLQEEILRQQTVISQTSQALNLCSSTAEFSGSMEQVEGERLLLIATQKRQACLNEVTRLNAFGTQGENIADGTGTLTANDLQLPLKREFIASQLEGKGSDTVHHFLCLIRHGAQVIVTQMMSTDDKTTDGALCFTNHIQLRNLPADFSVIFEVYALQTKKEVLSHEKKYHIKREHSKIRLTPKGKKSDGKILLPAVCSPGGPSAVRSPSFGIVGYTRFSLLNCTKKTFTLDKVPFASPLEGVLRVRLQLHTEHKVMEKGFLTMFEDVSGFGAWHRRWCALDAGHLSYWKYPDDEHKKEPAGMIDLKQCVTSQVKLAPRDVCARPHTIQLVTVRPQEKGDKNTLISRSVNTLTTTKHLLSADTKEERILWCNKLNEALESVRKWDPRALKPVNTM